MKTRTIKELIKLTLKYIEHLEKHDEYNEELSSGLCYLWLCMWDYEMITKSEKENLLEYLKRNAPKYGPIELDYYFWKKGDFKLRKKWLKKQL